MRHLIVQTAQRITVFDGDFPGDQKDGGVSNAPRQRDARLASETADQAFSPNPDRPEYGNWSLCG